jgi:hypothetical protein
MEALILPQSSSLLPLFVVHK